jgi:hypothetical protein
MDFVHFANSRVAQAERRGGRSSGTMNHKVPAVGQDFLGWRGRGLGNRLQGVPIVYCCTGGHVQSKITKTVDEMVRLCWHPVVDPLLDGNDG